MSKVYFHSPSDTAELRGAERAYFGGLMSDIGMRALGISEMFDYDNAKFIAALDPPPAYHVDARHLPTLLRANEGSLSLRFGGETHNVWDLFLNAVLAMGNDALCFAARLHAQCEIHGWVVPEDRAWLADVIEGARRNGLYRAGMGWEDVVPFLRSSETEPVVLSYSVCESFPGRHVTDVSDDAWENLPREEQWAVAWAALKARNDLRICKDGVLFGDGVNAFQARDAVTGWSARWSKDKK